MTSSYHFSFCYLYQNDQTTPPQNPNSTSIPIQSSSSSSNPIPVHYPASMAAAAAATKIQSAYRSHLVRSLVRKILSVSSEADRLQRLIQQQETVDSVRSSDRERVRLGEKLMRLLLELDSVPGHFDPNVRDLRRSVSRRIVGLQEILDGIVGERVEFEGFEELPGSWREFVEKIWAEEDREWERGQRRWCTCSCSCRRLRT